MTKPKKYNLTKDKEAIVFNYICTKLDFASVDYRMYDYLLANLDNTDHAIAKKPYVLSFLVDIVYTGVMHLEYESKKTFFDCLDSFKQSYFIEFTSLIYIIDLVLIDFNLKYKNTLKSTPVVSKEKGN